MRSASPTAPQDGRHPLFRRRAVALIAALLAHLLLVGLVLTLPPKFQKLSPPSLASFHLLPNPRPAAKPKPRAKTVTKVQQPKSAAAPKTPTPAHAISQTPTKLNILPIELATSDIGKLPHAAPPAGGSGGSSEGDSSVGAGQGPGGETLYNAEWFTEPTDAQLSYYLPRDHRIEGWGIIACRTAPRYRVEDCVPLEESPFGSRISQFVQQAAWQFRVLPPRLGGKAMVGSWVRIKITFSDRESK